MDNKVHALQPSNGTVEPDLELQEFIRLVESFEIDPGNKALSFSSRLARENNWTVEFAERVVVEYKRFCILAIRAGHPVTPSEQVDQAWHLHLTYTRSYWDRFCGEVLRRPLHHEPTAGGAVEGGKFRDWYSRTLDSYQRIFGSKPPEDIWPSIHSRFEHAGSWKWVNVGRAWVVPKRSVFAAAVMLLAVTALVLAGCQPLTWNANLDAPMVLAGLSPFNLGAIQFMVFYMGLACVLFVIFWQARNHDRQVWESKSSKVNPDELSAEEVAVLSGGGSRLSQLALAQLYSEKHIEAKQRWFQVPLLTAIGTGPKQSGVYKEVFDEIQRSQSPRVTQAVQPFYDDYDRKLKSMGLRFPSRWYSVPGNWLLAGLIGLGAARVIQGLATGHSVAYLVSTMFLVVFVSILINRRALRNTPEGERIVEQLQAKYEQAKAAVADKAQAVDAPPNSLNPVFMGVALLGGAALVGLPGFDGLQPTIDRIKPSQDGSSGGGCGGGCGGGGGGGGCGGGCGGCGGCGG
jgi:uncharacterized protein (TIGR04222 family)